MVDLSWEGGGEFRTVTGLPAVCKALCMTGPGADANHWTCAMPYFHRCRPFMLYASEKHCASVRVRQQGGSGNASWEVHVHVSCYARGLFQCTCMQAPWLTRPALKCGNSKSSTSTVRRGRGLEWSSNVSTSASRLAAWASDGLFHNQYIPFGTSRCCQAFMMPANLLQHAQPAPHENIESGSACRQVLIPPVVVAMACTIMGLEGSLEGSIGPLACWRGSCLRCP